MKCQYVRVERFTPGDWACQCFSFTPTRARTGLYEYSLPTIPGWRRRTVSLGEVQRRSLVDQAIMKLREGILAGDLPGGTRLSVADLKVELGVSHIPIREALRRLEAEGLVEMVPNRGAVVSPLDPGELADIVRLRILIEGDRALAAAKLYTEANIDELTQLAAAMTDDGDDYRRISTAHDAFHRALVSPALSAWDRRVLDMLWQASGRYLRFMYATFSDQGHAALFAHQHHALVDAARARDGRTLKRLLREQLLGGLATVLHAVEAAKKE